MGDGGGDRCPTSAGNDRDCFHWLRAAMGPDELLGSDDNHELVDEYPVGGQVPLWGGFSVDNPTLNRFYSFHYTLPFVLVGLSVFHIAAMHQYGSTNPLGINRQSTPIAFLTYYGSKDLIGILFMLLALSGHQIVRAPPPGTSRQSDARQPLRHTSAHRARVVLPLGLRHPA